MRYTMIIAAALALANQARAETIFYGDGIHDDADALEALAVGNAVKPLKPNMVTFDKEGPYIVNADIRICRPVNLQYKVRFYFDKLSVVVRMSGPSFDVFHTVRYTTFFGISAENFNTVVKNPGDMYGNTVLAVKPCVSDGRS